LKEDYKKNFLYYDRKNNSRDYFDLGRVRSSFSLPLADIYTQKINIPILRYFGATVKNNLQEDEKTSNVFYGYENFYSPINNFDYFVNWFVRRENFENREKIRKKNLDYQDNHLATVRNALHIFLGYFQYAVFQNIRVENDEATNGNLENLCIDKNGVTFNLAQLSKGEQFILLLVADIAQRLAIANPSRENALEGNGIVLIDEMEIHLHPAWQREVLPCLLKTFPNIQFFITTYSPQIVSSIDKKNVYIIDNFKLYQTSHQTKGRDTNSLLNEIFGFRERPEYAFKDFQQLYELIDDPDTEGAAAEKLEAMRQTYGEDDPDWQRAKMHFEFLTAKTVE
jgi:predicted ATP-binding protein involved in virulence